MYRVGDIPDCKMPLTNLAKVFGPTIIGYSVADPEPLQMINETKYQAMVCCDSILSFSTYFYCSEIFY